MGIKKINKLMSSLVFYRGTKEEIIKELNNIGLRDNCILEPFEQPLKNGDFGFNTNLGMIKNHYLDFEVYMLPTNKKDNFIITEVIPF